jgi:hypothetical protein
MDDDNVQQEGKDLMIELRCYCRYVQIAASTMFY